ncbi:mitochondrial/chloroplast ribosomal protein L54/L37 [Irpex rosettiformis]|uniref:Mitochondrial/chloroplast ribosomal protein L54/L37 n=1 Tax=Irpex rosettiformis TaxID=378272 RepID=A0ACB8TX51_9APHY|nr:mitochondrial/chloroplast ribosomal protein L54/L37 [Irpex rosettiformis]
MSLLRALQRPPLFNTCWRSTRSFAKASRPVWQEASATAEAAKAKVVDDKTPKSSCAEGTELVGLRWLKDQGPVVAKADDEYPDWLWTLLQPKELPDDGPGGLAEKKKLRTLNRERIREKNFMSTQ